MDLYRYQPPHDVASVDIALETILSFLDSRRMCDCICEIMEGLAFGCRTSPIILSESPYTGSYPYLALACHLIRKQDFLAQWCGSETFELCLEGLLSRKGPNKYDLEKLMPTVWWPGSREDSCTENNMRQTAQALSKSISKVSSPIFIFGATFL
jgi:Kip1 ubiquitination-promoting complex protein 1